MYISNNKHKFLLTNKRNETLNHMLYNTILV